MVYTVKGKDKLVAHKRCHLRLREKASGMLARPRLVVTRSNHHVVAQMIDDTIDHILVLASDIEAALVKEVSTKTKKAHKIGTLVVEHVKTAGVIAVVFDHGDSKYFDHIIAVAEAAREGGLELRLDRRKGRPADGCTAAK